uniref:Uncharacterized protein n=1 Tax=Anguilla anguilla TaxID=7936 RepID=A0A0E9PSR0_ANGAN
MTNFRCATSYLFLSETGNGERQQYCFWRQIMKKIQKDKIRISSRISTLF